MNSKTKETILFSDSLSESCFRNKITYLSFFLSILVVLHHTVNIEVYEITGGALYWIELFIREMSDIAVPTFLFISGYLFFQNYTMEVLLKKWKSRFFSLVIPYLIWNVLSYLCTFILSAIPFLKGKLTNPIDEFHPLEFFRVIITGEQNYISWFLRGLIIYVIITPLLYGIIKNKYGAVITMIGVLVLLTIVNQQIVNCWIMFIAGACVGIHGKPFMTARFSLNSVIVSFIYLLISLLSGVVFGLRTTHHQITVYSLVRLSQVIAVWIFAEVFAKEIKPKKWMTISFFIYCCHDLILESVEKGILILFGKTLHGAVIDLIFAPAFTLIIIILLAAVLRRIKPVWYVLTGNRG